MTVLSRPALKTAIRIAVTIAFVYFVNRSIHVTDIIHLIRSIHTLPVFTAIILGIGSFFFQILRWQVILRSHNLPGSFMIALKTMFRGFLLAFITPGRIGELFRAVHIDSRRHFATVVAVIEERSFAVGVTVLAGMGCMIAQRAFYNLPFFMPVIVASVLLAIAASALVIAMYSGEALCPERVRLSARFGRLFDYLRRIKSLPFFRLFMLSAGAHLLLLVQTALLFGMFGSQDFGRNFVAAGQAFSFMLLLPFFIANIGLREYSFSLFLTRLSSGYPDVSAIQGIALGVATTILFINIIIPAAVGLIWIYTDKRALTATATNLRASSREAENPYSTVDTK